MSQAGNPGRGQDPRVLAHAPPTAEVPGAQEGRTAPSAVTFHPDVELAQVGLQRPLQEPHVLQSRTQKGSAPPQAESPALPDGHLWAELPPSPQGRVRPRPTPHPRSRSPHGGWPTSEHSCRLRPSSCRLSREARLGGAPGEGTLHVGGAVSQAALDAVALVEFVHLPGARDGGSCPRRKQGPGPDPSAITHPLGEADPALRSPPSP